MIQGLGQGIDQYGQGYSQGKVDANSNWYGHGTMSDICPYSGISQAYIDGYKSGYDVAWTAFSAATP